MSDDIDVACENWLNSIHADNGSIHTQLFSEV